MSIKQNVTMLKADPSVLPCKARRLVRDVSRKAVGFMRVGSGHMIFEINRSGEDFTDTGN